MALDETDESKALKVASEVCDLVDAIKINWPLVLSTSPEMITHLSHLAPVICDFKVADIPNTDRLIVEQVRKRGASGVIVHAFTGSDSLAEAVRAAQDIDVFEASRRGPSRGYRSSPRPWRRGGSPIWPLTRGLPV